MSRRSAITSRQGRRPTPSKSYELTGNPARALQTYWKLWHDDPDSAYAVLARAKLDPVP